MPDALVLDLYCPGARVLDLCCGGGGAARGYLNGGAGYVVGVDTDPGVKEDFGRAMHEWQFGEFLEADALDVLADPVYLRDFDLIHASFPCQGYSRMSNCRPGLGDTYPKLIEPGLELLRATGLPFVIENVVSQETDRLLPGAITLCGTMFNRPMYRHRLFYANGFSLTAPKRTRLDSFLSPNSRCGWHHPVKAARAGHWEPGYYVSVSGHERRGLVNFAMEIDWMAKRDHVAEAIPPCFTEYVMQEYMNRKVD
jgi:DNA (cytosine-5)-methyltransferase 1